MSSQQGAPTRPWFRLANMVRQPPAAPTQQPDSAPAFRASPATPPPPPPPATPPKLPIPQVPRPMPSPKSPYPPLQQSPPPPPTRTIPPLLTTTTPTASPPKTVKPLAKTPPPSPLSLPSPQLNSYNRNGPEYMQKTVLVQETKEKTKALDTGDHHRHMGWTAHNPKGDATKKPDPSKKHSDSEDSRMRKITIAGENKGAIMDFSPFSNKTLEFGNNPHTLQNPSASSNGNKSGTDSDERSKAKNKSHKPTSQLVTAFMNSNVQGANNSILYNSSTTHHDPGVHLSLSRKPNGNHGFHIKDHKDHIY